MQAGERSADMLGWIASLLIHVLTLGAAIVLAADFSLIPRPKPFQWNVSLIAAPRPEPVISDVPLASHTGPVSPSIDADSQIAKATVSRQQYHPKAKSIRPAPKPEIDPPSSNVQTEEAAIAEPVNGKSSLQGPTVSPVDPSPDRQSEEWEELHGDSAEDYVDPFPVDLAGLPVSPTVPGEQPPPDVDAPPEMLPASEPAVQEPDRLAYRPAPQFRDPMISKTLHADYGWLAHDIFARVETLKRYPYLAKNNRWQGNVVLQAVISEDGEVSDIQIVESSGHAMLDGDAITYWHRYPRSNSNTRWVNHISSCRSPSAIDWSNGPMANGDTPSWLSAFEQHHDDLLRFFTRKLGCRELAADCAQETYVHLARMGPSVTVQNPRAFLFRVAANLAIDYLRKARTRGTVLSLEPPPEETPSMAPSPEDVIEAKQRMVQLEAAIGELSLKCRTALLLNRLEGKTHAEIARTLGVSESMVAKYIVQGLKHCRARLQQGP